MISEVFLVDSISWVDQIPVFALNCLKIIGPCNCPTSSSTENVPVIPTWENNAFNMYSSMSMSLLFYAYDFTDTFTYKKCVSNILCPVCASVKIHGLIVFPEYTEFKWNKNGNTLWGKACFIITLDTHLFCA